MTEPTEARKALHELIDLLREVDERYLSPEWLIQGPQDTAEGLRQVLHALQGGLQGWFETDADHPEFRRIVAPWRKFTGDNADAIYFDAPVRGDRRYRVRGRMDDAVYVSRLAPTAMVFIPCKDGISHNEAESATAADAAAGTNVLLHAMLDRAGA